MNQDKIFYEKCSEVLLEALSLFSTGDAKYRERVVKSLPKSLHFNWENLDFRPEESHEIYNLLKNIRINTSNENRKPITDFILRIETSKPALQTIINEHSCNINIDRIKDESLNHIIFTKKICDALLNNIEIVKKVDGFREEVTYFKSILLKYGIHALIGSPEILKETFSTTEVKANANRIRYKECLSKYKKNYSNKEYLQVCKNIKRAHSKLFHFTWTGDIKILKPQKDLVLDIHFSDVKSAINTENHKALKSIIKKMGISLFGGSYSELLNSDNYVYLGFDFRAVHSSTFSQLPNKILLDLNMLPTEKTYVTICHRQLCSLLVSLNIDFLTDFPSHLVPMMNLWNKGILSINDYFELMADIFSICDIEKTMLKDSNLLDLVSSIMNNPECQVNQEYMPQEFLRLMKSSLPNATILNNIHRICSECGIFPPLVGDIIFEGQIDL